MSFIGRFDAGPPNAITDFVTPLHKGVELRLRDRLGVSQSMGGKAAMGIETQNVDVHLRPRQPQSLLTKTKNLLRFEVLHQCRAVTVSIGPSQTSLIQQGWVQIQE